MHVARRKISWALLLVCCLLRQQFTSGQIAPYAGAEQYLRDLAERRAALMRHLEPNSVLVLWSAPRRVYSADIDYEYRQDSNLLYLTGLDQEETTLVMVATDQSKECFVFVRPNDALHELWYGHLLTQAEVTARSGITAVVTQKGTEAFDAFVDGLLGGTHPVPESVSSVPVAARSGRAHLGIIEPVGDPGAQVAQLAASDAVRWVHSMQQSRRGVTLFSAGPTLDALRSIKTAYEQRVLRRSVEISAEAHIEGMRATKPGRWEYEVEAAIEYWFHKNGALSPGYPSIVGSGPNATTLHYLKAERRMEAGDLVLVDAAGSFQGLTGDITRTYPVRGRYSAAQRELYDLVLQAQEAGIAAARPGSTPADVTKAVRRTIGAGLLRLGLVRDPAAVTGESPEIDLWFPHAPIHGIGMDVHDPLGRLDPGAAFVIEPGLYIRRDVLERLAGDPATLPFAERVRPAVARHLDMGIRLEDSFLMTATGPVMLSAKAPRLPAQIEAIVGRGR
jgi:Xaa-Pro aminopeptidase